MSEPFTEGPLDADIIIVGEAPGSHEVRLQRPFVGPSGQLMNTWLQRVGIDRRACYVTNTIGERPPENKLENLHPETLAMWRGKLHDRLLHLTSPKLVIAAGGTALQALLGRGSITKMRGSMCTYIRKDGLRIPMLPILHPAAVMRSPQLQERTIRDLTKARRVLDGELVADPVVDIAVAPDPHAYDMIESMLARAKDPATVLSIDIETIPNARIITCVGFSDNERRAVCIPTHAVYDDTRVPLWAWETIKELCASPCEKALQNGFYDLYWLRRIANLEVNNYLWDTRWMHHAIDPRDEHSLAHLASIYTDFNFWKDQSKSRLFEYNATDCAVTRLLQSTLRAELERLGRMPVYLKHYAEMYRPLFETMCHGIKIDDDERANRKEALEQECRALRQNVDGACGVDLAQLGHAQMAMVIIPSTRRSIKLEEDELKGKRGKEFTAKRAEIKAWKVRVTTDLKAARATIKEQEALSVFAEKAESEKKLKHFLYNVLKLPVRKRKGKPSTDENAMLSLRQWCETHKKPEIVPIIDDLLAFRSKAKMAGTFLKDDIVDPDGRVRCEYNFTPNTGRLGCSSNPLGTGMNLQNVIHEVRPMFKPDDGCVLVEVDLSQGEWRVMAMLSRDAKLIEMARTSPLEFDIHKFNASLCFGVSEADVTFQQRQVGKVGVHMLDYGGSAAALQRTLMAAGLTSGIGECEQIVERYMQSLPAIERWQEATRLELLRYRCLTTTWGRVWSIGPNERIDEALIRSAYACKPQSELADITNQYGFRPLYKWCARMRQQITHHFHVSLQLHDAIYMSVPLTYAYDAMCEAKLQMEQPRTYYGQGLTIPISYKVGSSWGTGVEFKTLPSRDDFYDQVTLEALAA